MRTKLGFVLVAFCGTWMLVNCSRGTDSDLKVIYGTDDRKELYDSANSETSVKLAQSTAALIKVSSIKVDADNDNFFNLPKTTLADEIPNLCKTERFRNEPADAFCSGFLVGPNLMATAGHCINTAADCKGTAFVFGYSYDSEDAAAPTKIDKDNIYYCKNIIKSVTTEGAEGDAPVSDEADFAIVEIDRTVTGHDPLSVRDSGKISSSAHVTVIGYPSGLPLKIAGDAIVRNNKPSAYFQTNTDTFAGNSGSAIFNDATGVVEGILVRGDKDFVSKGGCIQSYKCSNNGCRGEDVTRATEFSQYLNTEE